MILYLISLVVGGLIIGALARLLHPGRDEMSIPMTIGLGIVASLVGGLIFRPIFGFGGGFITAVLIAVLLIFLFNKFGNGRAGGSNGL